MSTSTLPTPTSTAITASSALVSLGACFDARDWLSSQPKAADAREYWEACPRADWLLWLAGRANVDRKLLVMAACACARLALVHVPAGELRPLRCIETAEAWTRGEATIEQVIAARSASWEAWRGAAYAAYGAYAAAAAGAYAAYAAAAADAAYADAYAAAAAEIAAASTEMRARCAAEVRRVIPWSVIDRAVYLRCGGALPEAA